MNFDIEIDGGINFDNCQSAIDAGANILFQEQQYLKVIMEI
jgi:pentose-5-phosphate-3-epimerase